MADLRHLVIDELVNPAVMSGLKVIAGSVTLDNTKVATISFPAKSILMAMGMIGVAGVAHTKTVTSGTGSVAFTAAANGTLDYVIVASVSEDIDLTDAGTADIAITPKV